MEVTVDVKNAQATEETRRSDMVASTEVVSGKPKRLNTHTKSEGPEFWRTVTGPNRCYQALKVAQNSALLSYLQ